MNNIKEKIKEMYTFILLWATQSFSALGSAMTSYALVIWSYEKQGSALVTSLLMVSSYAPYVILSVFAGALSDRWNKKIVMLVSDSIAALGTIIIFILLESGNLQVWHLYILNAVNGFMNTIQQPASEVAITRILPKKYYQKVGGIRYFSSAVNSILTPIIATAFMSIAGIKIVITFDLFTFIFAFVTLLFFIKIPEESVVGDKKEGILQSAYIGINYLKKNRGILDLILFLAAINFTASIYQAVFPVMILSRNGGSEKALGIVNTVIGITTLIGSIIASFVKTPKSRVRVICNALLFSMSFNNFFLAFGQSIWIWCFGAFLGWITIPLMSTNLEAILRLKIPEEIQGRVYSVRNSFQYFTIPMGYFFGGIFVDKVFEPIMTIQGADSLLVKLFGSGKGSGAAFLFFIIAFIGVLTCFFFRYDKNIWKLEEKKD